MHKKLSIIILLFVIPVWTYSQSVALVLSGGGAKAYSHIGVLKALEENNIPIDYIVGNSMGALIGAMYSSGYSPDEIEALISDPDFLRFKKENNVGNSCFYQVNESDASMVSFPFNIDKGFNIQIPINVYDFKEIDYGLMEFFSGASAASENDFNNLMIPFRCVAADIDSSRIVVFKHGNLAKAVRASITFPFFVRPIEIDSVLFFDGGMYNNFPVDVAISDFSPDFIIGSKAVDNYSSPNPDNAVSLMQSMLMTKADYKIDSTIGVVIESRTGNESIFQFTNVKSYIDSGYVSTQRMVHLIKNRFTEKQNDFSYDERRKLFRKEIPNKKLGDIRITGLNERQKQYFLKLIGNQERFNSHRQFHTFYNFLALNENIINLYPEQSYDSIAGIYNMNLIITKAEPFNLKIGGYISSSGVNEGYINLRYGYFGKSAKNFSIGAYFGTFYNSFSTMAKIEFPNKIPISLKLNFLVSRKNYFSNARYFFEDNFPAYIINDENYLEFSFGIPIANSGGISLGVSNINAYFQYYQDNYFTRTDTADVSNFYFLTPFLEYESSTLNRKQYPTKGYHMYGGLSYFSGNEKYTQGSGKSTPSEIKSNLGYYKVTFRLQKYFEIASKLSVGLRSEVGISNKPVLDNYVSSLLMATPYEPLPVMKTLFLENYRSNNYGGFGVAIDYNFFKRFNFRADGYYYLPYQKVLKRVGSNIAYYSEPFSYNYFVGSARIIYRPPIGVISASVNYIDKPGSKIGFLINLGYLIFNKSRLNR